MIAIAESGSTKTEWFIINQEGNTISHFNTKGFNPDFHESVDISDALARSPEIQTHGEEICKVYFFGASCSSLNNINKVKAGLMSVFPKSAIFVDHDLLACAYALSNGEPMITCILGTGSNSAYFNGVSMQEEVPALGVFMGDEASGGYFGKRLITDYFYKKLPVEIREDLESEFNLKWSVVRETIYGSNHANVFLASFMPFIFKHKENLYVQNLIDEGVEAFINAHVTCFQNYPSKQVGFVGTISYLFQDQIKAKLEAKGFELAKVIKGPGPELVRYLIEVKGVLKEAPESTPM